jgi:regulation of enolase protein 1 (concanavalin A-like superfamily)
MPPDSSSFTALNIPNDAVPEWMGAFTLVALPNTDLWRKPPARDTSTAPILFTALRSPFIAAEVTVTADWELEWDQAGLVIFAGAPPGRIAATAVPNAAISTPPNSSAVTNPSTAPAPMASDPAPNTAATNGVGAGAHAERGAPPAYVPPAAVSKWVKVGLEFCNNACHATSVCATSDGADWALTALSPQHARRNDLRVKIERIGDALWVWYEDGVTGWKKLREVTWFFWGVEDKAVRVGVYASRPANFGTSVYERRNGGSSSAHRNLCVQFEGLEIF